MEKPFKMRLGWTRDYRGERWNPNPSRQRIVGGESKAHPIGLLMVAGMFLIFALAIPEAVGLMMLAAACGLAVGLILWWKHR